MPKNKLAYIPLFAILTSPVYADDYNSYQAVEARAEANNARVSQDVDRQNMEDHMNSYQAPQPAYQQQSQYQSGSGYQR